MKGAADRAAAVGAAAGAGGLWLWHVRTMYRLSGAPGGVLDDAYIHFQYATLLARGHFFEWSPGDGYQAGATSVLWPLLLAPAYFFGLREERMALWASALGALLLGACLWLAYRILSEPPGDRIVGVVGALLVASSGAFLWGVLGGMEVGLATALALGALRAMQRGAWRWALASAALLPLARPDWAPLAALVWFCDARRDGQRVGARLRAAGIVGGPFAAYLLLNLFLTGHAAPNSALSKSLFGDPNLSLFAALGTYGRALGELLAVHLQSSRLLPPGALALVAIGVLCAAVARRAALFAGLALLASLTVRDPFRHFGRYQIPALPLLLIAVAAGLRALARLGGRRLGRKGERAILVVGGAALVGLQVPPLVRWNDQFAHNCRDIFAQQVQMGRWMREHLPPGARVAVHDAGAIPLTSHLRALDLVGLGSGFPWTRAWREGPGALFEALERLPPAARPDYFAIYPAWVKLPDLCGETVHRVHIEDNRTAGAADKVLCRARWDLAGSGQAPSLVHPGSVVDEVDVADVTDEQAHDYAIDRPAGTLYRLEHYAARSELAVADGGRILRGREAMRMHVQPGRPARLVWRTDAWFPVTLRVSVDGHVAEHVTIEQARAFVEPEALLPATLLGRPTVRITVELVSGREMTSLHYWVLQ